MAFLFKMSSDNKAVSPSGISTKLKHGQVDAQIDPKQLEAAAANVSVKAQIQEMKNPGQLSYQSDNKATRRATQSTNKSQGSGMNMSKPPAARTSLTLKPSRLKPPSTSSMYFSRAAGDNRSASHVVLKLKFILASYFLVQVSVSLHVGMI